MIERQELINTLNALRRENELEDRTSVGDGG